MVRVRRPPEWGVEPVPQGLRVLRTFDLFVLWSSLGIGLLVLAAGTLLIGVGGFGFGLTLSESAIVALLGSVVGSLMLAAAAHHGSRAGVPTMVSLRPILGRRGSYIPTALNVFQLLGWATFELLVMGIAAAALTGNVFGPSTTLLFVPLFGAVVAALALGGPLAVIRAWLEKFAIWLVYASTAAIGIALIFKSPDLGLRYAPQYFTGTTSLLLALDLVIAMPISWWPLISDYNRFARSSKDSWVGTTAGYTIANTVFYMLGAGLMALGIASGEPNFLAVIGLLGLGAFPLLIILVDETDNAFANVYSTAVSIQNLAPKRRQLSFIVAATLIAMGGAAFLWSRGEGIGGSYEGFLFLIGGLFVPLLGVVIADSFVVRRGTYAAEEFFEGARPWRWSAFASWIPGAALYFVIVIFALPVGATLPSFALAAGLQVVFSRLESSLTRPASAASGGDP